jgi:hypothetical protein
MKKAHKVSAAVVIKSSFEQILQRVLQLDGEPNYELILDSITYLFFQGYTFISTAWPHPALTVATRARDSNCLQIGPKLRDLKLIIIAKQVVPLYCAVNAPLSRKMPLFVCPPKCVGSRADRPPLSSVLLPFG